MLRDKLSLAKIAETCHEANRVYCEHLDGKPHLKWVDAPKWQRDSAGAGVAFRLQNPDAGPGAQHDAWVAHKRADGWVFGSPKDPVKKHHPDLLPFDALSKESQFKDVLFQTIVDALTR